MSLLLTGSKTIQIAGTEMSCIEIYTGEAYTFPFQFTDSVGNPINISSWTLAMSAKWYTCTTTYPFNSATTINIENITQLSPQPATPVTLTAGKTSGGTGGFGYIYVPSTITGGSGTPATPVLTVNDTTTCLVILTMTITRTDAVSGSSDISREPIGMIVRYQ